MFGKALDDDSAGNREMVKHEIALWQTDPDLASVRDSSELTKLVEHERRDWLAFWTKVDELSMKCQSARR